MLCCAWHLQLCLSELGLRICFFIITWVGAKTLFSGIFFFLSSFRKKRTLEQTKKTTDMETSKSQLTCLCLSYFICACMHVCMIAWLLSHSVVFDFLQPHGPSFSVHGIFQARILKPFPSPGDLPNPGVKPRSPTFQANSLPAEAQGKPKNTVVGSLSLLPRIFPIQESNRGHLHWRRILYQLSYEGNLDHQGSP